MPNAFATARETIAATIAAGVNVDVHAYPVPAVYPPAVVLVVNEPMAEPAAIGSRVRLKANYKLQLCVPMADNLAGLEALEELALDVLAALPSGAVVGSLTAPVTMTVGSSEMIVSELPLAVMIES